MNKILKATLCVQLGVFAMSNPLFAQTNTSVGNASGNGGSGIDNSFFGYATGTLNTTGSQNTFIGSSAGNINTSGAKNVFLGWYTGAVNTTGYNNLFAGSKAGKSNTTGFRNTYLGPGTGLSNVTGNNNAAIGYLAGRNNQFGSGNVYLGSRAGYSNLGSNNVFIGSQAGYNETGSNKLYIDNSATSTPLIHGDFGLDQLTINGRMSVTGDISGRNSLALSGSGGIPFLLSEEIINGCSESRWNFEVGRVCGVGPLPPGPFNAMTFRYKNDGINVGIGTSAPDYKLDVNGVARVSQLLTSSDKRFKQDIERIDNAGELLSKLEGVTYDYRQDVEGKNFPTTKQIGFIAQDVQKVLPEIVEEDGDGYLSVSYQSLIPVLVESHKELKTQNDELQDQLIEAQERNEELQSEIDEIKAMISEMMEENAATKSVKLESTSSQEMLFQNAPNPFSTYTNIQYDLPEIYADAEMIILNSKGEIIQSIDKLETGRSKVTLEANSLAPGTYHYKLVHQGKTLAAKSMVIVR